LHRTQTPEAKSRSDFMTGTIFSLEIAVERGADIDFAPEVWHSNLVCKN
jgi:hypothetical protein